MATKFDEKHTFDNVFAGKTIQQCEDEDRKRYRYFVPKDYLERSSGAKTAWYNVQRCAFNNRHDDGYARLDFKEAYCMHKSSVCIIELSQANEEKFFQMRDKFMAAYDTYQENDETVKLRQDFKNDRTLEYYKDKFYERNKQHWFDNNMTCGRI